MTSAWLVASLLSGCWPASAPPAPPAPTRAELTLDEGWSTRPWRWSRTYTEPRTMRGTFDLPARWIGGGSALVLDGLQWEAAVEVNGRSLSPVTGGMGPVEVPLGDALRPGENKIAITMRPPAGSMSGLTGVREPLIGLAAPPRLLLRPETHARALSLRAEGDEVRARVEIAGGAAARARVVVTLDGEVLQDLGSAEVIDGVAALPAARWCQRWWGPGPSGRGALYQVVTVLEGAGGEVLDVAGWRTGARALGLAGGALSLNGAPLRVLTDRARLEISLEEHAALLAPGAINGIEIHGRPIREGLLDRADELGIPVSAVPRCDGAARLSHAQVEALASELAAQDERMIDAVAGHPSLLVWVLEGAGGTLDAPAARFGADPEGRLVVGGALAPMLVTVGSGISQSDQRSARWIVEMAPSNRQDEREFGEIAPMFEGLEALLRGGVVGGAGVGPYEEDRILEDHYSEWVEASAAIRGAELAITPLDPGPRRASSRVSVQGPPKSTAWVEGGWATPRGVVLDRDGQGILEIWHAGAAAVTVGGARQEIALSAGAWRDFVWTGEIAAAGAAP